jgi:hypothetical protein
MRLSFSILYITQAPQTDANRRSPLVWLIGACLLQQTMQLLLHCSQVDDVRKVVEDLHLYSSGSKSSQWLQPAFFTWKQRLALQIYAQTWNKNMKTYTHRQTSISSGLGWVSDCRSTLVGMWVSHRRLGRLANPQGWKSVARVVRDGDVRVESMMGMWGLMGREVRKGQRSWLGCVLGVGFGRSDCIGPIDWSNWKKAWRQNNTCYLCFKECGTRSTR